jgi:hypothetical protein
MSKATKPIGGKCYGSVCHLPGSRLGPGDHKLTPGQARILTEKTRDLSDLVIVTEKLDGSNVGVAKVDGKCIPLVRAGYPALSSPYEQHHLFAGWVFEWYDTFDSLLVDGERVCGEWLAQAHGTRYALHHAPFVAFDLFSAGKRIRHADLQLRAAGAGLPLATVLHKGHAPCSILEAMRRLNVYGFHGATEPVEGAVWRVERDGDVDFLGKYVRPDKRDGVYLPEVSEQPAVWNWRPVPRKAEVPA